MRAILYAGGELVTGDAIADAILEYAEALALQRGAATIRFPVRDSDGVDVEATMLIGPASQILMRETHGVGGTELVADEVVDGIRARALELRYGPPTTDASDRGAEPPQQPIPWEDGF